MTVRTRARVLASSLIVAEFLALPAHAADAIATLRKLQPPAQIVASCPAAPSPDDGWEINPHVGAEPGFLLLVSWILNAHPDEDYEGEDLLGASLALLKDKESTVIVAGYAFPTSISLQAAVARAQRRREPSGRYAQIRPAWYPERYVLITKGTVLVVLQSNSRQGACFDSLRKWLTAE